MRHLICGIAASVLIAAAVHAAQADEFASLVADYEAWSEAQNVQARVRAGDLDAMREWRDISAETLQQQDAEIAGFYDRMRAIDPATLEGSDTASYAVLEHILRHGVALPRVQGMYFPFTNDSGFHTWADFAAMSVRIRNEDEAQAWIDRLAGYPAHLDAWMGWLDEAIEAGWTQPREIVPGVIDQIAAQIVDDPRESALYQPLANLPASIPAEAREALQARGAAVIADTVMPAIAGLRDYFENTYMPAARESIGVSEVPGGREYYRALVRYHTSLDLTPEEVHQTGLDEVARIRAEMDDVIARTGFEGSFDAFTHYLRTDPRFYAQSEMELMMRASYLSKLADDAMPAVFNRLPRLPYGVRPVPPALAPNYTTGRYWPGDAETGRAGGYMVNTYALDQRPLYELPALTLHEAVPGHHHQIALAQEIEDMPDFRRRASITAFTEGWGLYSEFLGLDMGFYEDAYEDFGRLSYEMWRACRLVVDTGMHYFGWTREEAESCFLDNSALAPLNVTNEVSRYISWPGQALAYKTGEILIRRLRSQGEARLGEDFDLADFHDTILEEGPLPLSYLETRMEAWIAEREG
ncbi:DUF885 family protein [Glycocaulis abyssi]|uniref:DUF885 domain-containing protein n=1 Tax=Glycocaulis abyssi TaxID=1433403 RepID=A0ABV9NAA4_9PROT